jgi:hypothetical protein
MDIINATLNNRDFFDRKVVVENNITFVLCLRSLAFVVSVVNMRIFAAFRLKDSLYGYLLIISMADATYSGLLFSLGVMARVCYEDDPVHCGPSLYYTYLIFYVFISEYLTSSIAFFNISLEIFVTIHRILLILHVNSFLKRIRVSYVCSFLLGISAVIYSPVLAMYNITDIGSRNETCSAGNEEYRLSKSNFGRSNTALSILTCISLVRITLVTVVLFMLNIIAIFKFKQYLKRKTDLKEANGMIFFFNSKFYFY